MLLSQLLLSQSLLLLSQSLLLQKLLLLLLLSQLLLLLSQLLLQLSQSLLLQKLLLLLSLQLSLLLLHRRELCAVVANSSLSSTRCRMHVSCQGLQCPWVVVPCDMELQVAELEAQNSKLQSQVLQLSIHSEVAVAP